MSKKSTATIIEFSPSIRIKVCQEVVKAVVKPQLKEVLVVFDDNSYTKSTCGENDTFDIEKGIAIAIAKKYLGSAGEFKRLVEKAVIVGEEKKELRLVLGASDFGKVGTPTKMKDKDGKPLFVGDVVEIEHSVAAKEFVVETILDGKFIMGIAWDCDKITGEIKEWTITKIKDWKEAKVGDNVNSIKVVEV